MAARAAAMDVEEVSSDEREKTPKKEKKRKKKKKRASTTESSSADSTSSDSSSEESSSESEKKKKKKKKKRKESSKKRYSEREGEARDSQRNNYPYRPPFRPFNKWKPRFGTDDARDREDDQARRGGDHRWKREKDAKDLLLGRAPAKRLYGLVDLEARLHKPKRAPTSYALFCSAQAQLVKDPNTRTRNATNSAAWKELQPEVKDRYERMAREKGEEYKKEKDRHQGALWVHAQMEDHLRNYQLGRLSEQELEGHCHDFWSQWAALSEDRKDKIHRNKDRQAQRVKKVVDRVGEQYLRDV